MTENQTALSVRSEFLENESATLAMATRLAAKLSTPLVIYLHGELGAGKTAFCRGIITALGHQGAVKSPTYTLVEPYQLKGWRIHHFDLYRLADPEELEYMGIRDYFAADTLNLIEWPERGEGWLPAADLDITLSYQDEGRMIELKAKTTTAQALIKSL
ncbi:MAG: tRNA (adenosine(37)-N6)-threonylcarbamoyltransferase complex ATPase subunit type 1 TsaE [Idiomarina sp.]|uniref:tRNA threonylcarbamoyladenosine biosynthesis protein TsaE n=1 Tax=Idiomarina aquatica TaxID=1327752 RepID=A0A4R6NY11_9GAMM|nr:MULTISPECIES: tRNA (adenosine(37)-N6)-threonylcarbamoyltransferase complex ATPase subunit type 1 TsaE [Idiomarina]MAK72300.1 tRNA (adenosine(37)-N6)-threonylcarbamoyltransferase complex ATPase subunit type 1 TsaE [Idiomarinaceae bacterium]MBL4741771.1 tRNA (adenosine(37)-N6)-threonylcarbamoyltransferase complex ATPase subunit type 1 TsaE [Idiomarina sp.]MBT43081.1 tRNA (adenosine(37)-N6)-threonylcarbamoyltransferase complex ATPase subunit type 1 TsaE [Idiomarina sp.]PHQ77599.1 MAG: tRNA (ade